MADTATKPRLKTRYQDEIKPALREQFDYSNVMQIPGVVKVVVNMGVGDAAKDSKLIEGAVRDLTSITGQKPVVTKARKSIAQFKLREGMPIGAHTTLRDAGELLVRSELARAPFGDEVVDHDVQAARTEVAAFDSAVTDWERVRGFERL